MEKNNITLHENVLEAIKRIKRPVNDRTGRARYLKLQLVKEILTTGKQK